MQWNCKGANAEAKGTKSPGAVHLVRRADYLISAAPLTPATRHLLGSDALSRIKPGALLINPSRGSVVDEQAVVNAKMNNKSRVFIGKL